MSEPAREAPRRAPWLPALIAGAAAAAVYLMTAAPGAWWGDGLELAAAAKVLGVPHPTGYPLFMLLGHGVIRLAPWADAGRALTVSCALLCAGSVALLVHLFTRFLSFSPLSPSLTLAHSRSGDLSAPPQTADVDRRNLTHPDAAQPPSAGSGAVIVSAAAALTLGFTRTLWEHATFTEVYPLTFLLVCAIVLVVSTFDLSPPSPFRVAGLGALCGCSALNHYSALAAGPLVLFVILSSAGSPRRAAANLSVFFLSFIPFLAGYLYIPMRAQTNPPINFGDPATFEGLLWTLRGGDYGAMNQLRAEWMGKLALDGLARWLFWHGRQVVPESALIDGGELGKSLTLQAGLVLAVAGILGCALIAARRRAFGAGLLVVLAATLGFSIFYRIPDIDAYFLPALPAMGLGWLEIGRRACARLRPAPAVAWAAFIPAALLGFAHFGSIEKRWDNGPEQWARAALDPLPEGALLITRQTADSEIYSLWYEQVVKGRRPDVSVFGAGFIFSGWYRRYFEADGRPKIPVFAQTRAPGEKRVYDAAILDGVIKPNLRQRRVFSTFVDPDFETEVRFKPARELLPVDYYLRSCYRLNPPSRQLYEILPREGMSPPDANRFRELFAEDPPGPR